MTSENPSSRSASTSASTSPSPGDSASPAPETPALAAYKEKVRALSAALVDAQQPIRILDAVKWRPEVEDAFFASKARELPAVGAEDYAAAGLGFDPREKASEMRDLGKAIVGALGPDDGLAQLMATIADEYRLACEMLEARGTKRFYELSRRLYGSPKDRFSEGENSVLDLGKLMFGILAELEGKRLGVESPKDIPAEEATRLLQERFDRSFMAGKIEVRISDGIVADAAAGASEIKLKEGAFFSKRDVDVFEVHEGWVHVATTLNGKSQPTASFLAKGPPRCAATQEGLAILMEVLTFSAFPRRARALTDRVLAIDMAENGADFLDVYKFYLSEGDSEADAFRNAQRVFRGGVVTGGAPFTKDVSYLKGFIECYNFIRVAIRGGRPEAVPFLFVGKTRTDDVPMLYAKHLEGVVAAPGLLPPHFADLNGLAIWMSFSNFLNLIDLTKIQARYDALFSKWN